MGVVLTLGQSPDCPTTTVPRAETNKPAAAPDYGEASRSPPAALLRACRQPEDIYGQSVRRMTAQPWTHKQEE
jgi:hypothetical protein